jgi:hypothetical protein
MHPTHMHTTFLQEVHAVPLACTAPLPPHPHPCSPPAEGALHIPIKVQQLLQATCKRRGHLRQVLSLRRNTQQLLHVQKASVVMQHDHPFVSLRSGDGACGTQYDLLLAKELLCVASLPAHNLTLYVTRGRCTSRMTPLYMASPRTTPTNWNSRSDSRLEEQQQQQQRGQGHGGWVTTPLLGNRQGTGPTKSSTPCQ